MADIDFHATSAFCKLNAERRTVTGWASVVRKDGELVVDSQGDVLDIENLRDVAQAFIASDRSGGYMHSRKDDGSLHTIGQVVESFVVDSEMAKALGMATSTEGWLITLKVLDDEVWAQVKAGKLTMFSIGGHGARTDI